MNLSAMMIRVPAFWSAPAKRSDDGALVLDCPPERPHPCVRFAAILAAPGKGF